MKCIEFQSALECAIEQRTQLSPGVLRHISHCAECRHFWELQNRVDEAIAAWHALQTPAPPVEKVLAILGRESAKWELDVFDAPSNFVAIDESDRSRRNGPVATRRQARRHARFDILAIALCAACLVQVLVSSVFVSRVSNTPQWDELTRRLRDRSSGLLVADSSSDLTSELSELIDGLRRQFYRVVVESNTAGSERNEEIPQNEVVLVDSRTNEAETRPASQDVERGCNPVVNRLQLGFGFLYQNF